MKELIYEKLAAIQAELKAPKTQFNKFGGYSYRRAEDILEAVKPLLAKYGCFLFCSDELELIGERYYIKAEARIICIEDGSGIHTTAYAREEMEKKGMDGSQVTGASSSYARKYALNGLLCIDDTADSDTTNVGDNAGNATEKGKKRAPAQQPTTKPAAKALPSQDKALWEKWVYAIATGTKTRSGKDPREAYLENYHPNDDELQALEDDVFKFQLSHGIDPEHPSVPANA